MSPPHSTNYSQAAGSYSQPILVQSSIPTPTSYPGFSFLDSPGAYNSVDSGSERSTDDTRESHPLTTYQQLPGHPIGYESSDRGGPGAANPLATTIARASAAHETRRSEQQAQAATDPESAMQLRRKQLRNPFEDGSKERTQPTESEPGVEQRVPEPRVNRPSQSNNGTIAPAPVLKKHSTFATPLEVVPQYHAEFEDEHSPFSVNSEALSAMKANMRTQDHKQFVKKYQERLAEEQTNVADLDDGLMGLLDLEMRILEEVKQEWETQEQSRRAASNTNLAESLKTVTLSNDQPVRQQSVYNTISKRQSCPCGSETCWALEHFKDVPRRGFQSIENCNTGAVVSLNAEKYAEHSYQQAVKKAEHKCGHRGEGRCETCVLNIQGQRESQLVELEAMERPYL